MTWMLHRQQQQCGAQLPKRPGERQLGEVPSEAVEDREVQDHEQAGETLPPGDYPASPLEDRDEDITPTATEPRDQWDEVVQPERRQRLGETELEQDERGDDAEQTAALDYDEGEAAEDFDRND